MLVPKQWPIQEAVYVSLLDAELVDLLMEVIPNRLEEKVGNADLWEEQYFGGAIQRLEHFKIAIVLEKLEHG